MTMTVTESEIFADIAEHFADETPCNSSLCEQLNKGVHAAAYIVIGSCECIYYWCENRRTIYESGPKRIVCQNGHGRNQWVRQYTRLKG